MYQVLTIGSQLRSYWKTLDDLRRFTVSRNFLKPTIRSSALFTAWILCRQISIRERVAQAQDLILRQRVNNYHAGDLERRYATLDIEEDTFVVYGFVTKSLYALMHPRGEGSEPGKSENGKRGRPNSCFSLCVNAVRSIRVKWMNISAHGAVTNYGAARRMRRRTCSNCCITVDCCRWRGARTGIRIYSAREFERPPQGDKQARRCRLRLDPHWLASDPIGSIGDASEPERVVARIDALVVDVARSPLCAPLPGASLSHLISQLRYAVPQWQTELKSALQRAKRATRRRRRSHGVDWYWPATEKAARRATAEALEDRVRLLAPFDPVVRDRARFELLWGWEYRFEAYTPAPKRKLGYYALPLLWRDRVIGWANLSVKTAS